MVATGVLLAAGAFGLSRGKGAHRHPSATVASAALDEPVAAPDGLLVNVSVGNPNASWTRLQRGVGGAAAILPASAAGILCALTGLDPQLGSEIDGAAGAVGTVVGDPAAPRYLLALKLADPRKTRARLVEGDAARFASRDAGNAVELLAKRGGPSLVALGLSPNGYLLVAGASADLERLGPYVTRSLSRMVSSDAIAVDIPRAALGSLVTSQLGGLWAKAKAFLLAEDERMRRGHGGREPDHGDPKAIVAALDGWVTRRIAIVSDLEKVHIGIDVSNDGISFAGTMTPLASGGAAAKWTDAMAVGDATPVANLPAASALALLTRDNEADRVDQAREVEKLVTGALGPRLSESAAKRLHTVMEDNGKARADLLTAAVLWDDPRGFVLRAPLRDSEAASRCVQGAVDLAGVPPFRTLLRARSVTAVTDDVPGVGKVFLSTILRESRPARASQHVGNDGLGVAWKIQDGALSLAAGDVPIASLRAVVRPESKLGDDASLGRTIGALGRDASTVLVLQPLRFDPARANLPPAPVVAALGRNGRDATFRLDVAHGLLRELTRRYAGL